MADSVYIGESIAGLVCFIVGVRLLGLALRTGKAPEWLLSASFLGWGLSYVIDNVPEAFLSASLSGPFYFSGRLAATAGTVSYAFFTWRVFRKREAWGLWMVTGTTACLIAGLLGSVWAGDWRGIHPLRNPWWWAEWVGLVATDAWIGAEALVRYAKARERVGLGVCDPVLRNRFLLLGIASLLWGVMEFVVLAQTIEYEVIRHWSGRGDALVVGIEVVSLAMIWLVFLPPAFYRSWLRGAAPAARAVEG